MSQRAVLDTPRAPAVKPVQRSTKVLRSTPSAKGH